MESNEKEKGINESSKEKEDLPIERIETPFPAQELFPLDQANNDGKGKNDLDRIREQFEKKNK